MRPKVESGASLSAVPAKAMSAGGPKLARFRTLNASRRNSIRPSAPRSPHVRSPREREIERPEVRSGEVPATGVAEGAGRLQRERRRIEPLFQPTEDGVVRSVARRIARAIEADAGADRRVPQRPRAVALHEDRERLPAAHGPDAGCLPSSERPSESVDARQVDREIR